MHPIQVGPRALLVEVTGPAEATSLAAWARRARVDAAEVVPAAGTVLFDGVPDPEALLRLLDGWRPAEEPSDTAEVEVPTIYDGEDLDEVARLWGTDRQGVRSRHQEQVFTAAFCGFAPGFAYLAGLPADLHVPRLATPRTRVPAGAVALAGPWCGVYPTTSPGGWRIIGRADPVETVLWDVRRPEPALLAPGTRVRFVSR